MEGTPLTSKGPMPGYKSHKEVWAMKIRHIVSRVDGGAELTFEDGSGRPVSAEYVRKHDPQVGGYLVIYDDGYESWSPAEAFEAGYTKI